MPVASHLKQELEKKEQKRRRKKDRNRATLRKLRSAGIFSFCTSKT